MLLFLCTRVELTKENKYRCEFSFLTQPSTILTLEMKYPAQVGTEYSLLMRGNWGSEGYPTVADIKKLQISNTTLESKSK
jgi:hypothetical protein